jgi:hypothetical protein
MKDQAQIGADLKDKAHPGRFLALFDGADRRSGNTCLQGKVFLGKSQALAMCPNAPAKVLRISHAVDVRDNGVFLWHVPALSPAKWQ